LLLNIIGGDIVIITSSALPEIPAAGSEAKTFVG
jgi:hypothetical protein